MTEGGAKIQVKKLLDVQSEGLDQVREKVCSFLVKKYQNSRKKAQAGGGPPRVKLRHFEEVIGCPV